MLCKDNISNSLCSRTVDFIIFKVNFQSRNRIELKIFYPNSLPVYADKKN